MRIAVPRASVAMKSVDGEGPLVSVIIPTFNDRATLPQTVASILDQSHRELEVLIINDGGTSPREFLDLSDPRLRVIDLPENRGVSHARNTGFQAAQGTLVYFIDADDLAAPDLLAHAVAMLKGHSASLLLVGKQDVEDEQITPEFRFDMHRSELPPEILSGPSLLERIARQTGMFIPSAAIFRRAALNDCPGDLPWQTGLKNSEDTLLFLLLAVRGAFLYNPDPYVVYRRSADSVSRRYLASWSGRIAAMDVFLSHLKTGGDTSGQTAIARKVARAMRQNAARRTARALQAEGKTKAALRLLWEDLRQTPNAKSAFVMAQLAARGLIPVRGQSPLPPA